MIVLYGVADRDPNELVCMFFNKQSHMDEFVEELPGKYRMMVVKGVSYDKLKIKYQAEVA